MIWEIAIPCPFGNLYARFNSKHLISIGLKDCPLTQEEAYLPSLAKEIREQFIAYFKGRLKNFTLPYQFNSASDFELRCWKALCQIPYGQTISYSQQASYLGDEKKRRAVARANSKNSLAIIVPCHRVIYAHGGLGGYTTPIGKKTTFKQYLLDLERRYL